MGAFVDFSDSAIQAALIGSLSSVALAVGGGFALLWRIRRDARLAADQIRKNEVMRLKLKVYEEISPKIDDASSAVIELQGFVRNFLNELKAFTASSDKSNDLKKMQSRAPQLMNFASRQGQTLTDLFGTLERWRVIDLRLRIFNVAFSAVNYDISQKGAEFFHLSYMKMPTDLETTDEIMITVPPISVTYAEFAEIENVAQSYLKVLSDYQGFLYDLGVELQNSLLGDLFPGNPVPVRAPNDPTVIVLCLARENELLTRIETELDGGKKLRQIEMQSKAKFSAPASAVPPD